MPIIANLSLEFLRICLTPLIHPVEHEVLEGRTAPLFCLQLCLHHLEQGPTLSGVLKLL